jgi:hypothetical protein
MRRAGLGLGGGGRDGAGSRKVKPRRSGGPACSTRGADVAWGGKGVAGTGGVTLALSIGGTGGGETGTSAGGKAGKTGAAGGLGIGASTTRKGLPAPGRMPGMPN